MGFRGRASTRALATAALLCCTGSSVADAAQAGGSAAPATGGTTPAVPVAGAGGASASRVGGSQYGVTPPPPAAGRPVVSELNAPRTAKPGRPPLVTLRIDEKGVGTVRLRVTVSDLPTGRPIVISDMGWVHTARTLAVRWPRGAR